MADIKLLISLEEDDYKKLIKYGESLPCGNKYSIMKAVANGTLLPKECDIQRIIPKRVDVQKWIDTKCPNPNCNHKLSTFYSDGYYTIEHKLDFCPDCGQALLWESEEEQ